MSNIKTTSVQLGDNVTATQNFTLRTNNNGTLTLARGNVGATSQDLLTIDAAGLIFDKDGLDLRPLGVGQTWQSVARVNATDYTNTTGRSIMAQYAFSGGAGLTGLFTIDGFAMPTNSPGSTASGMQFVAEAIIPPGAVYRFTTNGSFVSAQELR